MVRLMNPKVTVIMPSLNVVKYIRECIESVVRQTLQEIEILCVDAGSTDGTLEILREYEKKDFRVHIILSNVKSYGTQVNLGLRHATGAFVAIVETDDYIECDMFEKLYYIAIENDVDYVKADYDWFNELSDDARVFGRVRLFGSDERFYNKVICPIYNNHLYLFDYNLWKGIYNRNFLIENDIFLNETSGAAYQDIGFSQLVLMHARKAWYSNLSFYRYNLGRAGSSSNSLNGLIYAKNEFERLLELHVQKKCIKNIKGLYLRMAMSFLGEYKVYIKRNNFLKTSEEIQFCVNWFVEELRTKIKCGIIEKEDFEGSYFEELEYILNQPDNFVQEVRLYDEKRERVINIVKNNSNGVVIYGAGNVGKRVLVELNANRINVLAFADANANNSSIANIPIFKLRDCLKKVPLATYIIANKNNYQEMYALYINEGGSDTHCIKAWE